MALKGVLVGEKKESLAALHLSTGLQEMLQAFSVARDSEDTEKMKAESRVMHVLGPRRFVGEELPVEAALREGAADNGHGQLTSGATGFTTCTTVSG